MQHRLRKLLPFVFVLVLGAFTWDKPLQAGGEIPWPLSNQEVVSVDHSKGLWKLSNTDGVKIYNVEMVADPRSGYDWIRVAELNSKTWEVVSWGEGFFNSKPQTIGGGQSSYFDVSLSGPMKDTMGRYLTMFPNGDLTQDTYLLRIVEVKTAVGNVLGLSIIDYKTMDSDHYLGTRVMKKPLKCEEDHESGANLICNLY